MKRIYNSWVLTITVPDSQNLLLVGGWLAKLWGYMTISETILTLLTKLGKNHLINRLTIINAWNYWSTVLFNFFFIHIIPYATFWIVFYELKLMTYYSNTFSLNGETKTVWWVQHWWRLVCTWRLVHITIHTPTEEHTLQEQYSFIIGSNRSKPFFD